MQLPSLPVSLRVRLIGIVFLSVLPAMALLLLTAMNERRVAEDELEQSVSRLANFVAREEQQLFRATEHMLVTLGQFIRHRESHSMDCDAFFARILSQYERYINLGAVDERGETFCTAVPEREGTQYTNSSALKNVQHPGIT